MDLKSIVDADRLSTLRTGRGRLQRQGLEEADVVTAEGAREEGGK